MVTNLRVVSPGLVAEPSGPVMPKPSPSATLISEPVRRPAMELLVVDDDQTFREELADLLRGEGHKVRVAASVPKALEELERQDFDLLLTDLKMPRHSGLELLEEVRKRWPRTLVVMITGYATVETAVQAMKSGAFDYIRKPFQVQQVRQVLDLGEQELNFQAGGAAPGDAAGLARRWVRSHGLEVLLVTPRSVKEAPGVTVFPTGAAGPARIREVVESFISARSRAGVVLEDVHLLFDGRRRQDVLEFLTALRDLVKEHGPLVVTVDPVRLTENDLADLRAAVVAPSTHATLEVLANPLRRAVLRRASHGACTFTQAMQAVGLDDSPKLSFHLRKLVEEGLLLHRGEDYRITPKGQEAVDLLTRIDAMAPSSGQGNAVLASRPTTP